MRLLTALFVCRVAMVTLAFQFSRILAKSVGSTQLPRVPIIAMGIADSSGDKKSKWLAKAPQPVNGRKSNPLKVGALFGLWYALNVGYNVYNKRALMLAPGLTYTIAFLQLAVGMLFVSPLWILGFRKRPQLSVGEMKQMFPIAVYHLLTHLGAVVSLGAGAISFTSVVKAAEPAISALLGVLFYQIYLPWQVYLSLLPVMCGVGLAALGELSFSPLSFGAAMVSNLASAARVLASKQTLDKPLGRNMDASNLYAVTTLLAAAVALPVSVLLEGRTLVPTVRSLRTNGVHKAVALYTVLSALFYYLYNEVAFHTLDNVAPVTHAVGNTIKRVVIILASVVVFGTPLTPRGVIGAAMAVGGVLLYSLAKNRFKN